MSQSNFYGFDGDESYEEAVDRLINKKPDYYGVYDSDAYYKWVNDVYKDRKDIPAWRWSYDTYPLQQAERIKRHKQNLDELEKSITKLADHLHSEIPEMAKLIVEPPKRKAKIEPTFLQSVDNLTESLQTLLEQLQERDRPWYVVGYIAMLACLIFGIVMLRFMGLL